MLRETSAARTTAASTSAGASAASAQRPADAVSARTTVIKARRTRKPPIAASIAPRDEDYVPPTKTARRKDDRKARGFPNQGQPEKDRPRKPQDRRRAAGAQTEVQGRWRQFASGSSRRSFAPMPMAGALPSAVSRKLPPRLGPWRNPIRSRRETASCR